MTTETYTWYKIANSAEELNWQQNNLLILEVGGKKVSLARYQEKLFAFAHQCPHAGGILGEGNLDAAGNIVCPLHHYKFSILTGRNVSGEGYKLKIFPLQYRENGIYLGLEEKGSWKLF